MNRYDTLLQNATDITEKCDKILLQMQQFFLQNVTVLLQIATISFQNVSRLLLQNATSFTNCNSRGTYTSNGIYNKLYSKLLHVISKHAPINNLTNRDAK